MWTLTCAPPLQPITRYHSSASWRILFLLFFFFLSSPVELHLSVFSAGFLSVITGFHPSILTETAEKTPCCFLSLMRFDSCCYFSSGGGCCAHKSSGASRSSNSYCCEYFSCACPLWIRHEMCVDLKCVGWYVSTSSNCTKMKLKYLKYKRCHLVLET